MNPITHSHIDLDLLYKQMFVLLPDSLSIIGSGILKLAILEAEAKAINLLLRMSVSSSLIYELCFPITHRRDHNIYLWVCLLFWHASAKV